MLDSQECGPQVVRILVPGACSGRSQLKRLNEEGCSPCFLVCEPSSSHSDCPSSGPDVLLWHDSATQVVAKKQIAEIHTGVPFGLANVYFCSYTLNLQQPWQAEGAGAVPNDGTTLQQQLCAANKALCDQSCSPWKHNLARLLCCSPGVQRMPAGEISSMTARVLERLFVRDTRVRTSQTTCKSHLLWRAVLATIFSHALAWLITSAMPHCSVVDSSSIDDFFGAARTGLDW